MSIALLEDLRNFLQGSLKVNETNKVYNFDTQGIGFGLTITNILAMEVGQQTLKVVSEENEGTEFQFQFKQYRVHSKIFSYGFVRSSVALEEEES